MKFLLDTSVCIPLINGSDSALKERLLSTSRSTVFLCSVVKAELLYGANHSMRVAENLDRINRFAEVFESFTFDDQAAVHYGIIRARLKSEGRMIGANDLMIAAIALTNHATLITRNIKEFRRVPTLLTEEW